MAQLKSRKTTKEEVINRGDYENFAEKHESSGRERDWWKGKSIWF